MKRPRPAAQPLGSVGQHGHVVGLGLARGQREVGVSRRHQVEHARVKVEVRQVVLAAQGEGGVAVHPFRQRSGRLARLRAVEAAARWHARVTRVSGAEEQRGDVDALRRRAALDAQLEPLAAGALLGDVAREPGREGQVAPDLAHDERGAEVAGVDLHVTAGLPLHDPHGDEVLERGRVHAAAHAGRKRTTPLAAVDERRGDGVDGRLVRAFRGAVRPPFDDDSDLEAKRDNLTINHWQIKLEYKKRQTERGDVECEFRASIAQSRPE